MEKLDSCEIAVRLLHWRKTAFDAEEVTIAIVPCATRVCIGSRKLSEESNVFCGPSGMKSLKVLAMRGEDLALVLWKVCSRLTMPALV
jgi:hypothetical protein